MKRRPLPAMPAIHLPHPPRIGMRRQAFESLLRIGQLILLIWLGIVGGRFLAKGLIQAVEAIGQLLA